MNGGARGRATRSLAMALHPCGGLNRSRYAAQRGRRHREIARTNEIGATFHRIATATLRRKRQESKREAPRVSPQTCGKLIRRPLTATRFHRINDLR